MRIDIEMMSTMSCNDNNHKNNVKSEEVIWLINITDHIEASIQRREEYTSTAKRNI